MLNRCKWLLVIVVALLATVPAMAGPPAMGPVTFPVDTSSVATELAAAGAVLLLLVFSTGIGFSLAWKLYRRIKGSI